MLSKVARLSCVVARSSPVAERRLVCNLIGPFPLTGCELKVGHFPGSVALYGIDCIIVSSCPAMGMVAPLSVDMCRGIGEGKGHCREGEELVSLFASIWDVCEADFGLLALRNFRNRDSMMIAMIDIDSYYRQSPSELEPTAEVLTDRLQGVDSSLNRARSNSYISAVPVSDFRIEVVANDRKPENRRVVELSQSSRYVVQEVPA